MDKVSAVVVIKEIGKNKQLGYRELRKLFQTIKRRAATYIKGEFTEIYASDNEMEKGVLELHIRISADIIGTYDYIRAMIEDGIRWFTRVELTNIITVNSEPEPPFIKTVKPIFTEIELGYYIDLSTAWTPRASLRINEEES